MKKMLALVLALMLALFAVPALADSVDVVPGTPTTANFTAFSAVFDTMTQAAGYKFTWDTASVSENGYDVYTAHAEEGNLEARVYTVGGNVSHIICTSSGTFGANDVAAATRFGEFIGAAISGNNLALLMLEDGVETAQAKSTSLQSEMTPLIQLLSNGVSDLDQFARGIAGTATILSYPTGLEYRGSASGASNVSLFLKVVITSRDGQINIVK